MGGLGYVFTWPGKGGTEADGGTAAIDDSFVAYLFELVEEQSEIEDPYHYVIIRVLVRAPWIHHAREVG